MLVEKKTIMISSVAAIFFAALFFSFFPHRLTAPSDSSSSPSKKSDEKIIALVVPHHAPVSALIDEVVQKVDWQPKRIILIGPNHPDAGGARVITGISDSEKKFLFDEKYIQDMINSGMAVRNQPILQKEHSIGVPLEILERYFPQAKFVPLILSSENTQKDTEILGKFLASKFDEETLLVASIDFSHYLPSDLTEEKDQQTIKAIEQRDYSTIESFKSDFADSPASLMTLLASLDTLGPSEMTVVRNTNSGKYSGIPIKSSTSYITMTFSRSTE